MMNMMLRKYQKSSDSKQEEIQLLELGLVSLINIQLRAWNALPQAAVEADTLNQFKASLPGATN